MAYNGVLLIDKPSGHTSHDVVARVRRKLGMKRVGHAGTLDPMATGLLILLIGQATKASESLMGLGKSYSGTIAFGATTDTLDKEGALTGSFPLPGLDLKQMQEAATFWEGPQLQIPPMYSAKKIAGKALYKLARQGKEIERPARAIVIDRFEISRCEDGEADFIVQCSKGTYIRSLADDFARKLGSGGHLTALRRLSIGPFSLDNAISLADFLKLEVDQIPSRLLEWTRS